MDHEEDPRVVPDTQTIDGEAGALPEYEPPKVLTYRGEAVLDALGPAQACSFTGSVVGC